MNKYKKGLIGSILISVILAVTLTYVWATTPTTTFYISTGVYPGAPYYTIWTEGSGVTQTYYAKRYDGYIPTWSGSTNASYVVNQALTNVSNTGTVKLLGEIICANSVILTANSNHNGMNLDFDMLKFTSDVDGIVIQKGSSAYWYGKLTGRILCYVVTGYTHSLLKLQNIAGGHVEISNYIGIFAGSIAVGCVGLELLSETSGVMFNNFFINRILGFETAILCNVTGAYGASFVGCNNFYDTNILMEETGSKYGVRMTSTSGGDCGANNFYAITVNNALTNGVAFQHDGTYTYRVQNYLFNFETIDMGSGSKDLSVGDKCDLYLIGGEVEHGNWSKAGTGQIIFAYVYQMSATGTAGFSSNTSVTFNHGMTETPNRVFASFSSTAITGWTWTATSTQITITVAPSGTYTVYWEAEYQP